ncbi:MAG: hypothetical protein AAF488_16225 [Planctomycetota bacterium]
MKIAKLVIEEQRRPFLVPSTLFLTLAAMTLPFLTHVLALWIGRNSQYSWLGIDRGDLLGLGYFARLASLSAAEGFGSTRSDSIGGWLLLCTLGAVVVGVLLRVVQAERPRSRLIDGTVFVTMTAGLLLLAYCLSTGWTSTPAPTFADYDRLYRERFAKHPGYGLRRYGELLAQYGQPIPAEVRAQLDPYDLEDVERGVSGFGPWSRNGGVRWSSF